MKAIFTFVLSIFFILSLSFASARDISDAIGMWSFDDVVGDTVKDSSGKGNHGKIIGGAEIVKGKIGNAIKYNGTNQCVEVPHNETLDLTEQVTMMCWYYWEGAGDGWQTFFSKGPMSGTNENWALFINSAGAYFHFITTPNGARMNVDSPGGVVKKKEWQFVAGTYDGKSVKIYLDGELIKEQPMSGKMTPNKNALRLGHREGSSHWWMGMQDEMAVFKRALSKDEINAFMKEGIAKFTAVESKKKATVTWGEIKSR